jgi:hypothetical protein
MGKRKAKRKALSVLAHSSRLRLVHGVDFDTTPPPPSYKIECPSDIALPSPGLVASFRQAALEASEETTMTDVISSTGDAVLGTSWTLVIRTSVVAFARTTRKRGCRTLTSQGTT